MKKIKISVRKIVEHIMRCGDIDSRYVDSSIMSDGAAIHRRIQKSMGESYQKEVSLSVEAEIHGIPYIIQGRADGIITNSDGSITVDEIKSTTLPLEKLFEGQHELHLGQAQCYAYMILYNRAESGQEAQIETVNIQLTYFQMDTEELVRHNFTFTSDEIRSFFNKLLEQYAVWLKYEKDWAETRDSSIKNMAFPFPEYRKGQRELAVAVYRTIENKKKLYAQAPTGIGKTLSALFPSVKAVGEEKCGKIFYLTAKTVTRTVAEEAVQLMANAGLRFKSVTLRAKEKICFCEEVICNPDYCEYAKGHYDRANDALLDILEHNDIISPDIVMEYSKKYKVCPHETSLDLSLWADMVVGDYNHAFDPFSFLRRFFTDTNESDYVFLIDEAHNLADRVRDMYSAVIRKSDFLSLKNEMKESDSTYNKIKKALRDVNSYMLNIRKANENKSCFETKELDETLLETVKAFTGAAEEWLAENAKQAPADAETQELNAKLIDLYFAASEYTAIAEGYGEHYTSINEIYGSEVVNTLFCIDPSSIIEKNLAKAKASIMFSATLTPLPYFREILGGCEEDFILSLPSPFDEEKLLLAANCAVSTKYIHRENSLEPLAELIFESISRHRGNYLVFFPSYEYMRQVYDVFSEKHPDIDTILQDTKMSEQERLDFLARFDAENKKTLAGFCVLGGIFSEGIDLKGGRLIGSVIVGVGLPKISFRQDLLKDYYNRKNGAGFDYAYVFPGMNKVLQAAGRVIRTEDDYGLVLLIDSRFNTPLYRSLFPKHWSHIQMLRQPEELKKIISEFKYFKTE